VQSRKNKEVSVTETKHEKMRVVEEVEGKGDVYRL
jgi:hypothetical protein